MDNQTKKVNIRKFERQDREEVRRISYRTSFLGHGKDFIDDESIVADGLTLYFTDDEPDSCFVAVHEGKVIGYLIASADVPSMDKIFSRKIIPHLFFEILKRGLLLRKKTWVFMFHCTASFLKGEFNIPRLSPKYPATFHINIEEGFQRQGIGQRLVKVFLEHLKSRHVHGVYVSTFSEKAKDFFLRLGFRVIFTAPRTYMHYRLDFVSTLYILGMSL